ncbi:hypothetical protein HPQ64_12940 [Rhizobiales bacterium]|uniref:hypothetical protein n=1 Tax=Hongsoonwoonella zoysiae TaxID=2821844 RepID=UPI0015602126|nr:hypothetical protein [Hongsoonwoonella zoysiae]NRG18596.1 hypothetical protein [Hongsoonwoonella zoysiae]
MPSGFLNVNVFSNVASTDIGRCLAPLAVRSCLDTFCLRNRDGVVIRAFVDPNPNPSHFDAWADAIRGGLPGVNVEVVKTTGLASGFIKSIEMCEAPYAIQLEHDFVFVGRRIDHSIDEILAGMRRLGINYLKFNKRANRVRGYDHFMVQAGDEVLPVCRINGRSNNPQIVEIDYYRRMVVPLLDPSRKGASGVEGWICRQIGGGYVYGALGHPATAAHLDGRNVRFKDRIRRALYKRAAAPEMRSS